MGEVRRGARWSTGPFDRGGWIEKTRRRPGNEADRFTVLPLSLFPFPILRAPVVVMMVMVVSVLPGGHPRCVPNKPTCWRDNGSTVTTQLLERVKRVRGGEGREGGSHDYREYTHYRQKAIEFEF